MRLLAGQRTWLKCLFIAGIYSTAIFTSYTLQTIFQSLMYIKLLFRNCSYGPLRAPSTLGHICQILKLSVNASPTLVSLDRAQPVVIVDLDQEISSGVWELMATDATDTETRANATVKPKSNPHRKEYQHRVEPMQIMEESRATPLSDSDLSACISALVSLISSIPARYIKYNSKLSLQITQAHAQGTLY